MGAVLLLGFSFFVSVSLGTKDRWLSRFLSLAPFWSSLRFALLFDVDSCLWSLFIFIPLFIFFFHGMKAGKRIKFPRMQYLI